MNLSISQKALIDFLLQAKRHTYAAQGDQASVTPLLSGARQLEFQAESWHYRDIYFGFAYFVGQETVYYAEAPVWAMGYAGGMLDATTSPEVTGQVYNFLQAALRQVEPERPYRGPRFYTNGAWTYVDETHGGLSVFWGLETISHAGVSVYQLRYHGGYIY
jgi:hypothetical protein